MIREIVFYLVLLLIILNILDIILSYIAINKRGAEEGNPLMRNMVKKWWKVILFKTVTLFWLWVLFVPFYLMSIWFIIPIDIFYIIVVISNSDVVYKRRGEK